MQIDKGNMVIYNPGMNDVQEAIGVLVGKGWSLAAIADELQVHAETVMRWKAGSTYPVNSRPVAMALEALSRRRRVPKRKRYTRKPPATNDRGL